MKVLLMRRVDVGSKPLLGTELSAVLGTELSAVLGTELSAVLVPEPSAVLGAERSGVLGRHLVECSSIWRCINDNLTPTITTDGNHFLSDPYR